jgi:uncharacterized protein YecA (UPF0149 family)
MNAVRHGLTGQTLVLTPEETESYSEHVREYISKYEPADHYQRQIDQQLADSDWGIHQIFLLQSATISYMQGLSLKLAAADSEAAAEIEASDARAVRKLATLNSYENRKRRASKLLRQQIDELALEDSAKPMETQPEPEIGFVYPASESKAPETPNPAQNRTTAKPQPGRNAPCPCRSGLKFKRCCANKPTPA